MKPACLKLCAALFPIALWILAGCSTPSDNPCGDGGELIEQNMGRFCTYVVIEGGFQCPPAFEFRFGFDGRPGAICANRDLPPAEIPPQVCIAIGQADCSDLTEIPAQPSIDAGARRDSSMPRDANMQDADVPEDAQASDAARMDSAVDGSMPDAGTADDANTPGDSGPVSDGAQDTATASDANGDDAGRAACNASSCGSDTCGRSPCGYPCGVTPPGFTCFLGVPTDTPPGEPCIDAWGDRIGEGVRSFRACAADPTRLERCECSGGGPNAWMCTGGCVDVVVDETPRRGSACLHDSHCGALPCSIGHCGEVCSQVQACPGNDLTCVIPGDFAGVCLDSCTTCGATCGENWLCMPDQLGGGRTEFGCGPSGSLLSATSCS